MCSKPTALLSVCACIFVSTARAAEPTGTTGSRQTWPLFVFDNGLGRGELSFDEQVAILAEFGYDGLGYTGVKDIPLVLKALGARGLKMYSTYLRVDLSPGQPPYDPGLPEAIRQLDGQGTILWLHVHGKPSPATDLDDVAVEVIRRIADMAADSHLPVALYPHTGFYVATASDAVRLVKKVDRENVGASFNLCHFLKQHDPEDLSKQLEEVTPYLFVVSINGADSGKTTTLGWDRLIQTLDRGSFDVDGLLGMLKAVGYNGPIGLQCYRIPGDVRENLRWSMKAWRGFSSTRH